MEAYSMIQPPTDNLYKFMAIFGLVLFLAGTLYPAKKIEDISRRIGNMNHLISEELIIFKRQDLQDKLVRIEKGLKNKNVDSEKEQLLKGIQYFENRNPSVDKALKEIETEIEILIGYLVFGIFTTIMGIVLMIFGFRLWYTRLQKYPDAQLLCGDSGKNPIADIPIKSKSNKTAEEGPPPSTATS